MLPCGPHACIAFSNVLVHPADFHYHCVTWICTWPARSWPVVQRILFLISQWCRQCCPQELCIFIYFPSRRWIHQHTYNQGGCIYHAWPVHTGGEWSLVCQRRLVAQVQCPVICWQMCWLWSMGVSLICRHEDRRSSYYVRLSLLLVATLHTVKPLRNHRCVCCIFAPTVTKDCRTGLNHVHMHSDVDLYSCRYDITYL